MKWLEGRQLRINDRVAWVNPKDGCYYPVTYKGYLSPRKSNVTMDGVQFGVYTSDLRLLETKKEVQS